MESLWILIPLSVAIALLIAWAFVWATDSGQFDDLQGPGERLMQDDDRAPDLDDSTTKEQTAAPKDLRH